MPVSQQVLQGQLSELVAKHRVPGAVVAVWQDGELITAAAGLANLNTGVPMTVDTAFLTGSITKVWATTMFMTFVEEGLLDLDVPIVSYAPGIQFGADVDVARSLTFRHLVNHSNGVDSSDLFVKTRPYPEGVEDYLGPLAQSGKLTEPGIVSSYNNAGWIIAELVLRRLTGNDFVQHLDQRVVKRLGLKRTVFSAREAMLHRTAIGSYPASDGTHTATTQFMYPDTWAAPGTMTITTVEDQIAFLRMHLDWRGTARRNEAAQPRVHRGDADADQPGPDRAGQRLRAGLDVQPARRHPHLLPWWRFTRRSGACADLATRTISRWLPSSTAISAGRCTTSSSGWCCPSGRPRWPRDR